MRVLDDIDVDRLSIRSSSKDANDIVQPDCDQLVTVWCVRQISWSRSVCRCSVREVGNIW